MAKSKFYSVKLSRNAAEPYLSNGNCKYFIFQQINDDDDKNDKEFILGFYAIDKAGNKLNADYIALSKTDGVTQSGKKRNLFGNMTITRRSLEDLFGSVDQLNFIPRPFGHYIAYTIQAAAAFAPYALDPSPPAPPPTDDDLE